MYIYISERERASKIDNTTVVAVSTLGLKRPTALSTPRQSPIQVLT